MDVIRSFDSLVLLTTIKNLFETLQEIHSNKVIHGDIKPDNLMAVDEGASKLKFVDFGLADDKEYEFRVGTVDYWTPSLMLAERNNLSVDDYWALIVSAFEIHFGRGCLESNLFYKLANIEKKLGIHPNEDVIDEKFKARVNMCFQAFEYSINEAFGERKAFSQNLMEKFLKECGEDAREAYNWFYFNALMLITVPEGDFDKMNREELIKKFKDTMEPSDLNKIIKLVRKFKSPLSGSDLGKTGALFTRFVSPFQESIDLCTEFQKPKPLKTKMVI